VLAADASTQAQIDAAFAEVQRRGGEVQAALQAALRDIANALPPEQRKAFFRAAFQRHGRRPRR
jgi:predicted component of type VI protein secretion system